MRYLATRFSSRFDEWATLAKIGCGLSAIIVVLARVLRPSWVYKEDILIDYLAALALRDGLPVLTPLRELQLRYFPDIPPAYPYPNFHPPTIWLINLPFTLLPFPVVALFWLALSIVLVLVVARWLGLRFVSGLALLAWPPIFFHLDIGQYELVILALTVWAWRSAAAGKDWRAGALLGAAALLKFYPALFLVPYLVRRRWRVVEGGVLVGALGLVVSVLVLGPDGVLRYVQGLYGVEQGVILQSWGNSSPYVALVRLLGGTPYVMPLVAAPQLILPLTLAFSLVGLVALAWLPPRWAPAAVLVLLPNVVYYCSVLALPPLLTALRERSLRSWAIAAGIALSVTYPLLQNTLPPPLPNDLAHQMVFNILCTSQAVGYVLLLGVGIALTLREHRARTTDKPTSGLVVTHDRSR